MYGISSHLRRGCETKEVFYHITTGAFLLVLAGCAGINANDDAMVKLQANDNIINASWTLDHPWAKEFISQAAKFRLYGQYVSHGKHVEVPLANAQLTGQTGWTFQLPEKLPATPESPVCLHISAGRNQSIPVRSNGSAQYDTARFRYEPWERNIRNTSRLAEQQREINLLETAISQDEASVATYKKNLAARGIKTQGDCTREEMTGTPSVAEAAPGKVVEPSRQQAASERICVHRTRNWGSKIILPPVYVIDVPAILKLYFDARAITSPSSRNDQLYSQFQKDWASWYKETGEGFLPEIGEKNDILAEVGLVTAAINRWNTNPQNRNNTDLNIIANGMLDAYTGCLEDVNKQLNANYNAWQLAQKNKESRDQRYSEFKQAECVRESTNIASTMQKIDTQRQKLQTLKLTPAPNNSPATTLPIRYSLNDKLCSG